MRARLLTAALGLFAENGYEATTIDQDTLTRWMTETEPPFDLPAVLAGKLDLVLDGLATR